MDRVSRQPLADGRAAGDRAAPPRFGAVRVGVRPDEVTTLRSRLGPEIGEVPGGHVRILSRPDEFWSAW
jgi:hypothetical protein